MKLRKIRGQGILLWELFGRRGHIGWQRFWIVGRHSFFTCTHYCFGWASFVIDKTAQQIRDKATTP